MLNQDVDFEEFTCDFLAAILSGVEYLAEYYGGETFYGLAIYCDSFDGDFGLYANSLERFAVILEKYRAKYPSQYEKSEHINELRKNCGDHFFQSFHPDGTGYLKSVDEALADWCRIIYDLSYNQDALSEDDYRKFDECGCRVANSVEESQELSQLKLSQDFEIQVCKHDEKVSAGFARYEWWKKHGDLKNFDAWSDTQPP